MRFTPQVFQCGLQVCRHCVIVAGLVLVAGSVSAQGTPTVAELEAELEQQKKALQEAIADREATAFRAEEVESMLAESEEIKRQVEFEVKLLCEEKEALEPGSFADCMSSSDS